MARWTKQGATLAEVMIGLLVFAIFTLAITATLIQAARLEQKEEENTHVTFVAQRLIEQRVDEARTPTGYANLANVPVSPAPEAGFLYQQEVVELTPGLKKITVSLFYVDRENPAVVDAGRPRGGEALTLGVTVGEPHP